MRRFALAAVVAVLGLAAFAPSADAQVVIGTRPVYAPGTVVSPYGVIPAVAPATTGAVYTAGYYSPFPGYMYSPFATNHVPAGYGTYYNPGLYSYGAYYRPRYYTSPPGGVLYGHPMRGRSYWR
jgi:hypothetical protein